MPFRSTVNLAGVHAAFDGLSLDAPGHKVDLGFKPAQIFNANSTPVQSIQLSRPIFGFDR
jgi:hypothetical protein